MTLVKATASHHYVSVTSGRRQSATDAAGAAAAAAAVAAAAAAVSAVAVAARATRLILFRRK